MGYFDDKKKAIAQAQQDPRKDQLGGAPAGYQIDIDHYGRTGEIRYVKMSGSDRFARASQPYAEVLIPAAAAAIGGAAISGLGAGAGAAGAGASGAGASGGGGILGGLGKLGGALWNNKDLILGGLGAINAARDSSKASGLQDAMLQRAQAKDVELAPLRALAMQKAQAPMPTAPDLGPLFRKNNPNPFA